MKLFKELAVLDPSHAAFYWDQHSLLHVRQVMPPPLSLYDEVWCLCACTTCAVTLLSTHELDDWKPFTHFACLQRISESMDSPGLNWYQLDQLSLTKFAGAERLLWVQKLDLSNNKLRSLDGECRKSVHF